MSLVNGKRITLKRARPNPLFQDWLEELYVEAQQKKSKLECVLKEALTSLSKYPLPLQSGAECAILKGFDKRLCLFLDKRLDEYQNLNSKSPNHSPSECVNNTSPKNIYTKSSQQNINNEDPNHYSNGYVNNSPKRLCTKSSPNLSQSKENALEILSNDINKKTRKSKNKYKPAFRSGGYAILMALLDHNTHSNHETLNKDELIKIAQKYCEESFTRPKPDTYYTAWSNMSRLVTKGLVNKTGSRKSQYSLTELGLSVAKELLTETKTMPSINDIIFNGQQFDTVSKNVESDIILIEECGSTHNYISKEVPQIQNHFTDVLPVHSLDQLIVMDPGSYDIVLLIDKNETSGVSKKNDPTVAQFNKYPDLNHEYRSLKVGDFTWVARHKTTSQELVLPYVVERKRMDDLGASIKDGRFHEQKFRLRKCGLKNVIYMVENYGSNKHVGLPVQTLLQALANTRMQDGFKVHVTDSLTHSARFLAMMTLRLTYEFKDKTLKGHNKETIDNILMTFEFFNKASLKNKPLSVTDTFIKLLLQLKGVSVEKALAITNLYRTPKSLINAYEFCSQKEGEMLLANLKCGDMSRNVGLSVSKTVYQLFTFKNFS